MLAVVLAAAGLAVLPVGGAVGTAAAAPPAPPAGYSVFYSVSGVVLPQTSDPGHIHSFVIPSQCDDIYAYYAFTSVDDGGIPGSTLRHRLRNASGQAITGTNSDAVGHGQTKVYDYYFTGPDSLGSIETWVSYTAGVYDFYVAVSGGADCESALLKDSEFFGANAAFPGQCPCQGVAGKPVDTRTGNEHFELPGVSIPGRGPGLNFQIAYNSLDATYDGGVGRGWRHSYDMSLELQADGTRTWVQETGATVTFFPDGAGGWLAPDRIEASLVENPDSTFTVERGHFEFFTFASSGKLTVISDRNGYETALSYDGGSGELDYVEDEAGRRLDFTWVSGRIDQVTDPLDPPDGPRTIQFSYVSDDLTGYTDIGGGDWVMTYDSHLLRTIRTPRHSDPAKVIEIHYDAEGRVDWQDDALDRRTEFHYDDPKPGATRVVDPNGDVRVDWYDGIGRREKVTFGYGTSDETSTHYIYDPSTYMLVEVVDGDGKSWKYEYDRFDPDKVTDPLNRVTETTYNQFGQPLLVTDAEQAITEFTYDTDGNPESIIRAKGTSLETTNTFYYDTVAPVFPGEIVRTNDGRGMDWHTEYDETYGYAETQTDPEGNVTETRYNNVGWVDYTIAPKGNLVGATPEDYTTHFEYNLYGDVTKIINPEDEETVWAFDDNRNIETTTNHDLEVTKYVYTDADELLTVTSGFGTADASTTTYGYWPDGQRKFWENGLGESWDYVYDPVGRLETETDPNNNVTAYGYDLRGNLTTVTQPGGDCDAATPLKCVTYSYDDAGQLKTIDYSEPATPDVTSYSYDDVGRRETAVLSTGDDWTWVWNDRGELSSHTDGADRTVTYTWDNAGNLDTIDYPGAAGIVDYHYDDVGRMDSLTDWLGNTTTFNWDENSNLDDTTFPAVTGNVDNYSYDRADRLDAITWTQGATTLGSVSYGRDNDGLISTATTTGLPTGPTGFDYDGRNQLTTLDATTAFVYDDAGNLTELADGRLQVFDPAQQLCWSSPTTSGTCASPPTDATIYGYDDRGYRTSMTDPDGTVSNYTYDQANRLTQADVTDATGDQFHPVAQTTVMETQAGYETGKCPNTTAECLPFTDTNGHLRTVQIAGEAGLPAAGEIEAVMLNVTAKNTVVTPGANAILSVWPADVAWPWSTTLSFQDGDTVTNSVITRLDEFGRINIVTSTGTDADVNISVQGYFAVADGSTDGQFSAVDPTFIMHPNGTGDCQPVACGTLDLTNPYRDVKVLGVAGVPTTPTSAPSPSTSPPPTPQVRDCWRSTPPAARVQSISCTSPASSSRTSPSSPWAPTAESRHRSSATPPMSSSPSTATSPETPPRTRAASTPCHPSCWSTPSLATRSVPAPTPQPNARHPRRSRPAPSKSPGKGPSPPPTSTPSRSTSPSTQPPPAGSPPGTAKDQLLQRSP